MPYKSEKMKLNDLQDRRRKLTSQDIEDIKNLYVPYEFGAQKIATMYGVSKRTILRLVSPQCAETEKRYNQKNWRHYQVKGEDWAAVQRKHRRYKQELYLKGELK